MQGFVKDLKKDLEILTSRIGIRHIQRGTVSISSSDVDVSLNGFNNSNKMMVLLNGSGFSQNSGATKDYDNGIAWSQEAHVKALSTQSLTLGISGDGYSNSNATISYQVIEFY